MRHHLLILISAVLIFSSQAAFALTAKEIAQKAKGSVVSIYTYKTEAKPSYTTEDGRLLSARDIEKAADLNSIILASAAAFPTLDIDKDGEEDTLTAPSEIVLLETLFPGKSSIKFSPLAKGTGFIITAGKNNTAIIVTNNHVIAGADMVAVRIQQEEPSPAAVLFTSPSHDIAVLSTQTTASFKVAEVELNLPEAGDKVYAVGNAMGMPNTVTEGLVSEIRSLAGTKPPLDLIQTDAAINPGNSGGPLFNEGGKVVGVNVMIMTRGGGSDGLGFSIPSGRMKYVLQKGFAAMGSRSLSNPIDSKVAIKINTR